MPYNAIPIIETRAQAKLLMEDNDLLCRVEYFTDSTGDPTVAGWVILGDLADDDHLAFKAADQVAEEASAEIGRHCVVIIERN